MTRRAVTRIVALTAAAAVTRGNRQGVCEIKETW